MSLQWKYQLYDFLLNTFGLEGRGDGSASWKMPARSPDTAEASSRESQELRMGVKARNRCKESLTTTREAAGLTTSQDCGGNEIKPCRIPIMFSLSLKKKTQQGGPWLKIETSCLVSLWTDLALHEVSKGCNKIYTFCTLQEQDIQAAKQREKRT